MKNMIVTMAMAMALTCTATLARAQPTTRPGVAPGGPARPNPRGGGGGAWRISPEERQAAVEFAREYMPNLHQEIEQSEGEPRRRYRMIHFAVEHLRVAQRAEREEPDRHEAALARARSHDEVFALLRELDEAQENQRPAIRARLREKVGEITRDLMEERARRIENLERMLKREKDQLENDRRNFEQEIERRVERLRKEMMGMPDSPPDMMRPDVNASPSTGPSDAPPDMRLPRGQ